MSPSDLALPHVAKLHAYTPGLQPSGSGWVKLNTNECPYPPSPRVAEALRREIGGDGAALRLYPNPARALYVTENREGLLPEVVIRQFNQCQPLHRTQVRHGAETYRHLTYFLCYRR